MVGFGGVLAVVGCWFLVVNPLGFSVFSYSAHPTFPAAIMDQAVVPTGGRSPYTGHRSTDTNLVTWLLTLWLVSLLLAFLLGMAFWMLCGSRLCQWRKRMGEQSLRGGRRIVQGSTPQPRNLLPQREGTAPPPSSRSTESRGSGRDGIRSLTSGANEA